MSAERRPPRRGLVPAAFAVALLFRLVGLGGSSMWLDEIMETLMAGGDLRQLGHALLFDRAMPPLEPLLTWGLLQAGWGELARRILNLVFSALAVALFARWAERRFGAATAALAALFLAASPVLVRYAHELRPYALALLFFAWALDAADRWLERGGRGFPLELAVAAALAASTHYFAVVVWLPIAAAFLEARLDGRAKQPLGPVHVGAVALALAPLALWWALLFARGGPPQPFVRIAWSWEAIEQRFDDLLLRGYAGQPTVHGATLLFAALAVVGFGLLARRRSGPTLFAGLFGGTLLVEFVLPLADRFSHFRYDQFGLPFVFVAMAFAIVAFSRQLARWNRHSGVATGALLAAAVVATSATGLVGYAQHGRPDWPAVARAVVALDGAEANVAVSIPWAQISLGYYLGRYERWPQEPRGIALLMNDRAKLAAAIASRSGCHLVLVAGHPRERDLLHGHRPKPPILRHTETDDADLYRFAGPGTDPATCFAPSGFRLEPSPGYGRIFPWAR
jgi:hypothetical protein